MKYTLKIKSNKDFKYIFKRGKFIKGKYINVYYMNNRNISDKNVNFLGICVSRKNGNSVGRNKLKRWSREVYKEQEKYIKKNISLIILYKKEVKVDELSYNLIESDLIYCMKGLNLYENF